MLRFFFQAEDGIRDGHVTGVQTCALPIYPQLSIADAYAVQQAWVALKMSQGRSIEGHMVGLTSKAMQLAFGIDEPGYGVLFDDMFYEDAAVLAIEDFSIR